MAPDETENLGSHPDAEAAFAAFLERKAAGEDVDFEAFCAERGDVADALRILHSIYQRTLDLANSESFAERLRKALGQELEGPCLDPAAREPNGQPSTSPAQPFPVARSETRHRYSLRGELARGGMGVILKVWDEDLNRPLAMKVMLGAGPPTSRGDTPRVDPLHLHRFLEEAQVTGQLDHPGVVPVHELGLDAEGRVFFTMRLVRGRDLRAIFDLAREGKDGWSLTRTLGVLVRVCETLGFAHSKGVIHRDLKPGNIMVGRFGETYVMDWGLAKVLGRKDAHDLRLQPGPPTSQVQVRTGGSAAAGEPGSALTTMDGTVVGTPAYMSPEQAEGRIEELDARSDVYSVGAMLYELLAAQMPYVKPGARLSPHTILTMVIQGPPTPIHVIRPGIPPELEAICEKAMSRDRERRYPTTLEMAEDLQAYLENRVVKAFRTGAIVELKKWVARNRGTAAAAAAAVLLAIGGLFAVNLVQRSLNRELAVERDAKSKALDEAVEARWSESQQRDLAETALAVSRERSSRLFAEKAERALAEGNVRSAAVFAAASIREEENAQARGILYRARARVPAHAPVWTGTRALGDPRCLTYSPDGKWLAAGEGASGRLKDHRVLLWEAATGRQVHELRGHEGAISSLAFSPDGRWLVSAAGDKTLRLWDVLSGTEKRRFAGEETIVTSLSFSPDGRQLAGACDRGVVLWDPKSGGEIGRIEKIDDQAFRPEILAFGPGGKLLVTGGPSPGGHPSSRGIILWDVATLKDVARLRGHEGAVTSVAYSPDGRWIASGSEDKTVVLWEVRQGRGGLEGAAAHRLEGHEGPVTSVSFSPDGTMLASACQPKVPDDPADPDGARIRLWEVGTGKKLREFLHPLQDGPVRSAEKAAGSGPALAFHPRGDVLASSCPDGAIRLWDVAKGEEIARQGGPTAPVGLFAFSSRGNLMAVSGGSLVVVREAATGKVAAMLHLPDRAVSKPTAGGRSLCFTSADRALIVRCGESVRVFDTSSWKEIAGLSWEREVGPGPPTDRKSPPTAEDRKIAIQLWSPSGRQALELSSLPSISPEGTRFATRTSEGALAVWDVPTGQQIATIEANIQMGTGPIILVSRAEPILWSPDGSRVAVRGSVWDASTGEQVAKLPPSFGGLPSSFSPRGRWIAVPDSWDGFAMHDLSLEDRGAPRSFNGRLESWSGDETRLLVSKDGVLRLYELAGSQEIGQVRLGYEQTLMASHPDSARIALVGKPGHGDGAIHVVDMLYGQEIARLEGYVSPGPAAFSSDGSRLASGTNVGNVRLWDLSRARATPGIEAKGHTLLAGSFRPDRRLIATTKVRTAGEDAPGEEPRVRVWDLRDGNELAGLDVEARGAEFSSSGARMATWTERSVQLWDPTTGREIARLGSDLPLATVVGFHPEGKLLAASTTEDRAIRLVELPEAKDIALLEGHGGGIRDIAFSPDGSLLASASRDATVRLWSVREKKETARLEGHTRPVYRLAWSADSMVLASGSTDGTVRLWDVASRTQRGVIRDTSLYGKDSIRRLLLSPGGSRLAIGSTGLTLWDTATKEVLFGVEEPATLSADWTRLAHVGDREIVVIDVSTGTRLRTLAWDKAKVTTMAFSPDGGVLAVASGRFISVFRVADARLLRRLEGHSKEISSLAFDPGGKLLVAIDKGGAVRAWEAETGRVVTRLEMSAARAVLGPQGDWVVQERLNGLQLWERKTGKGIVYELGRKREVLGGLISVRFSSDGELLTGVSGGGGEADEKGNTRSWKRAVHVVEAATGRLLRHLESPSDVVVSSDDHRVVAYGCDSNQVCVEWIVPAREPVRLEGHESKITELVFGPDGSRVVSRSQDGTARVWQLPEGREIARAGSRDDRIDMIVRNPVAPRVALGGSAGYVYLLDLASGREIRRLGGSGNRARLAWALYGLDGTVGAIVCLKRQTECVWELECGRQETHFDLGRPHLGEKQVLLSESGLLVTFSGNEREGQGLVSISGSAMGGQTARIKHCKSTPILSPDRKLLAVVRWELDPPGGRAFTAQLWDLSAGRELARLGEVLGVTPDRGPRVGGTFLFTADGKELIWAAPERIERWDLERLLEPREGILTRVEEEAQLRLDGVEVRPALEHHFTRLRD